MPATSPSGSDVATRERYGSLQPTQTSGTFPDQTLVAWLWTCKSLILNIIVSIRFQPSTAWKRHVAFAGAMRLGQHCKYSPKHIRLLYRKVFITHCKIFSPSAELWSCSLRIPKRPLLILQFGYTTVILKMHKWGRMYKHLYSDFPMQSQRQVLHAEK